MRLKNAFRLLALIAATSAVPYAASSCSAPTSSPSGTALDDVILEGSATRSALGNMLNAYATPWPDWGGVFSSPADRLQLSGATRATFAFATNVTGTSSCDAGSSGGAAGATASVSPTLPARSLPELLRLFGAEREAHAQSATFSGEGHFLLFATASGTVLRVFTSNLSYTPDNAAWQTLAATNGRTISLTITSAQFQNDLLTGCGPFLGQTITFTVK